jgi:predicted PurR-regulated permease PerM
MPASITQTAPDVAANAKPTGGQTLLPEVMVRMPIPWSRLAWSIGLTGFTVACCVVASRVRAVSVPMLVAFVVAYVLNPVVDALARFRINRTLAITLLLTAFLGITAAMGFILGPQIAAEARQVPDKLHQALDELRPLVWRVFTIELPHDLDTILDALKVEMVGHQDPGFGDIARAAGGILTVVFGGTVSVLASLGGVLMTPVFAFYLLRDFHVILDTIDKVTPRPARQSINRCLKDIDAALNGFIRGQLIVGGILAVIYSIGFALIGLPLALLVGIMTGLGNMVPYVGTAIGLVAATLMGFLSWNGWGTFASIYGLFILTHLVEGWVITPRIVGRSVGLSPFLIIVAILVFGELFGFFGVLVAVPATAVLKIVLRATQRHYEASALYRGELATTEQL